MSALGQKQTYAVQQPMSALLSIATAKCGFAKRYVRLTPNSGHVRCNSECPLCANSGHQPKFCAVHNRKRDRVQAASDAPAIVGGLLVSPIHSLHTTGRLSHSLDRLRRRAAAVMYVSS